MHFLEDVSFGYEEEKMVLKHLSFEIKTGEQVTMIGRTGAGKSTIFKLLLGLYRPQKGLCKNIWAGRLSASGQYQTASVWLRGAEL